MKMKNVRKNRIVALLVCLAMFVRLAFSAVVVVKNAGHQCTSDHCTICMQVKNAEKQIKQLGTAVKLVFATVFFAHCAFCFYAKPSPFKGCFTLITLKTELLD